MVLQKLFDGSRNVWANMRVETLKVDSGFELPDAAIPPSSIQPGLDLQVLITEQGVTTWGDPIIPITGIQSTGSTGFIYDNSVNVVRKNIELPDLQTIGQGAGNNTYLRHDNGTVSFVPLPAGGDNIYTADGVLTSGRVVDGDGNPLTFTNMSAILVEGPTTIDGNVDINANRINIDGNNTDNFIVTDYQQVSINSQNTFVSSDNVLALIGDLATQVNTPQFNFNTDVIRYLQTLPTGNILNNLLLSIDPVSGRTETVDGSSIGENIYNSDNALESDREVSGDGFSLTFNNMNNFEIEAAVPTAEFIITDFNLINIDSGTVNANVNRVIYTGNGSNSYLVSGYDTTQFQADGAVVINSLSVGVTISSTDAIFLQTPNLRLVGPPDGSLTDKLLTIGGTGGSQVREITINTLPSEIFTRQVQDGSYFLSVSYRCVATGPADLGSNFFETTSFLNSDDGQITNLLAGNNANDCLLIGSTVAPFNSILIDLTEPSVYGAGEIIGEYYSAGSSQFEQFRLFIAEADGDHNGLGNKPFEHKIGLVNYRTDIDTSDMGLVTINGVEAYYMRFRITSDILFTTVAKADYIKMYELDYAMKVNSDGFVEYFNDQKIENYNVAINSTPVKLGTENQDLYLATDFIIKYRENRFPTAIDSTASYGFELPANCDTSKPLRFTAKYVVDDNIGGDVIYRVRAAFVSSILDRPLFADLYYGSVAAPATPVGELIDTGSVVLTIPNGEANEVKVFQLDLDVSSVIGRRKNIGSNSGDLVFIQVSRLGTDVLDTYPGNASVAAITFQYTTWY